MLVNVKSERFPYTRENTERTTTRTALVDTQVVLTQDPRFKVVRFDDMDFNQFSRLEEYLINTGKNELQAQHVEMFKQRAAAEGFKVGVSKAGGEERWWRPRKAVKSFPKMCALLD